MNYDNLFSQNLEIHLKGRYITLSDIEPLLLKNNSDNQVQIIGKSVLGKPIYKYELGTGKTKVLLWSQMHGNESTTTKALFDFLNLYILGFFIYSTSYIISPDIATRISIYFLIFECVIVSNIAFNCKSNFYKSLLLITYVSLVGYKFLDIINH